MVLVTSKNFKEEIMDMIKFGIILLFISGLFHVLPVVGVNVSEMFGGSQIFQTILGLASLVVGGGLLVRKVVFA